MLSAGFRASRLLAGVVVLATVVALLGGGASEAQARSYRTVRYVEDGRGQLYLRFSFPKFFDSRLRRALRSGFRKLIYLEVRVKRASPRALTALAVRNCRVQYDLWRGTYRVAVESLLTYNSPRTRRPVVTASPTRVYRVTKLVQAIKHCAQVRLAIGPAALFPATKRGAKPNYFFSDVQVLFAPVPAAFLKKVRRWLRYPAGSSPGLSGLSLGTRISVIVQPRISRALKQLKFRTQKTWR